MKKETETVKNRRKSGKNERKRTRMHLRGKVHFFKEPRLLEGVKPNITNLRQRTIKCQSQFFCASNLKHFLFRWQESRWLSNFLGTVYDLRVRCIFVWLWPKFSFLGSNFKPKKAKSFSFTSVSTIDSKYNRQTHITHQNYWFITGSIAIKKPYLSHRSLKKLAYSQNDS